MSGEFAVRGSMRALLASGALVRIGRFEIPLRYWMFALRDRDIDPLVVQVARTASALADGGARSHLAEQV